MTLRFNLADVWELMKSEDRARITGHVGGWVIDAGFPEISQGVSLGSLVESESGRDELRLGSQHFLTGCRSTLSGRYDEEI